MLLNSLIFEQYFANFVKILLQALVTIFVKKQILILIVFFYIFEIIKYCIEYSKS